MEPFTLVELELLRLVRQALADAYPGRVLEVSLRTISRFDGADWLEVVVREGPGLHHEALARASITRQRLRALRQQLVAAFIVKLGPPRRGFPLM